MNTLKSLLSSGGIGLLTDECASVYLDDFDVLNVDCAKATISKALGLAIITASTIVKLPQILNMLKVTFVEKTTKCSKLLNQGQICRWPFIRVNSPRALSLCHHYRLRPRPRFPFLVVGRILVYGVANGVDCVSNLLLQWPNNTGRALHCRLLWLHFGSGSRYPNHFSSNKYFS